MKLKYIIILLIFSCSVFGQSYLLPKGAIQDSIKLKITLKNNIAIQNIEYIVNNDIDSLKSLIIQQIVLEDYSKAIHNIQKYRKVLAINDWEGNKLFSFEMYCYAMLLKNNNNINFDLAIDRTLKEKIKNLPESLLIKLKSELLVNVSNLKKNRADIFEELKNKEKISEAELTLLANSNIEFEVINTINKKALAILESTLSDNYIIQTKEINITKATLTVTIFHRKNLKLPQPAILYNNIYAGDKDSIIGLRAAIRDYVGVVVNVRGKRNSPNKIEPFENESTDLYEVIDWISKQGWCNGKVGMIGGSYLGFSQWAAVKKLHPALKTMVPQAAVGIGAMDFPMKNNVFKSNDLAWICYVTNNNLSDEKDYNDDEKWLSVFETYYKKGLKFSDLDSINGSRNIIFQRWLDHPSQDEYWQKMVPYKTDFSKINIPILTTTGFFDADQRGALYYFEEHNKYNKKAIHYLVIGPYDHVMAQSYAKNEVYGYKIDSVAKINITDLSYDWFDYILKGAKKPDLLKDKINVQVMGENKWEHFSSFKKTANKNLNFYLNKNSNSAFKKPRRNEFYTQVIDFKIRDYNKNYFSTGKDSISISNHVTVIESEILTKDIIIDGAFTGNIKVSINKKDFDICIDLLEVDSEGKILELSEYVGRASFSKDNTTRSLLIPNKVEIIPITNSTYIAKKVKKGSKLIIVYGVKFNRLWQVNYGTGKDVSEESMKDDALEPLIINWFNDSYVTIPVLENKN